MPYSDDAFSDVGKSQLLQLRFILDICLHLLSDSVLQCGSHRPRHQPQSLRPLVFFLHLNMPDLSEQYFVLQWLFILRESLRYFPQRRGRRLILVSYEYILHIVDHFEI